MFIDLSIYDNDKLIAGYYNENANILDLQQLLLDLFQVYMNETGKEIERKYEVIYEKN